MQPFPSDASLCHLKYKFAERMRNRGVIQGFKEVVDRMPKPAESVPAAEYREWHLLPGFRHPIAPGLTQLIEPLIQALN
jgi:hypothetical protein